MARARVVDPPDKQRIVALTFTFVPSHFRLSIWHACSLTAGQAHTNTPRHTSELVDAGDAVGIAALEHP